jgi:hypothetical protein
VLALPSVWILRSHRSRVIAAIIFGLLGGIVKIVSTLEQKPYFDSKEYLFGGQVMTGVNMSICTQTTLQMLFQKSEQATSSERAKMMAYSFSFLPFGIMFSVIMTWGSFFTVTDTYFFNAENSLYKISIIYAVELFL